MNPEQKSVALEARALSKTYALEGAPVEVLKGVTLTVNTGETLAVMGASGSGKSTLLHCLGGLDRPTSGQVFFNGGDLFAVSSAARTELRATKLGFVFQSYHLLPELDVLENVMLPALARRGALTRRAKLEERARGLLDSVGLAARAAHRPSELSGGEQQRAALARALMNEPRSSARISFPPDARPRPYAGDGDPQRRDRRALQSDVDFARRKAILTTVFACCSGGLGPPKATESEYYENLHERQVGGRGAREGLGLRPRPALWRRRLRGHPRLQRPRVQTR
ncbi:MAG: ABC transporter ATP-binding protein [Kiritimatiellaeota bacterium]|nr:ABC transporter ATP-binding protein [Kiritimatiellota bacterium]